MKNVAIYIRVSSEQQVKEGDSIAAQRDALIKYVNERSDLTLAGEYLDDGISGQKYTQRDELQRLLNDVSAGKVDLIAFTKLDRWFRSVRHYTATQEILDKYKVPWIAIWEPIYDTTTPSGRLIVNQMMSIAQFEAENTSSRIRQVQAYKVAQGEVISGSTPAGYSIIDKHLVPNEDADNVRLAFEIYSKTGNLNETLRQTAGLSGMPKTKPSLKKLLKNSKCIGEFRGNPSYCPPIVSRELFEDVQRKLPVNIKSDQKNTYIFSGLVRCAECGGAFGGNIRRRTRNGNQHLIIQYRCAKYYNHKYRTCGNNKVLNENVLERHILAHIRPDIENVILSAETRQKPANDAKKRVQALSKKLDKLKELFLNDLISLEEYKVTREEIMTEMEDLKRIPMPVNTNIDRLRMILKMDIESTYQKMNKEEKRNFWRGIIKEIRFGRDRKIEIIFLD